MLISGWKEIGRVWGMKGASIDSVRRKARRYHMPLFYDGNRPTIEEEALKIWWEKFIEKTEKTLKKV